MMSVFERQTCRQREVHRIKKGLFIYLVIVKQLSTSNVALPHNDSPTCHDPQLPAS